MDCYCTAACPHAGRQVGARDSDPDLPLPSWLLSPGSALPDAPELGSAAVGASSGGGGVAWGPAPGAVQPGPRYPGMPRTRTRSLPGNTPCLEAGLCPGQEVTRTLPASVCSKVKTEKSTPAMLLGRLRRGCIPALPGR